VTKQPDPGSPGGEKPREIRLGLNLTDEEIDEAVRRQPKAMRMLVGIPDDEAEPVNDHG
jgi:hypothetical protein